MILRAIAFVLSYTLWVYYSVIRYENPILSDSFSTISFGTYVERKPVNASSSRTPHATHSPSSPIVSSYKSPFETKTPLIPPTMEVVPPAVFNQSDVWEWKGLIDYKRVTDNCVDRFRSANVYYVIYNVETTVGFANQFRSLVGVFLIALLSNRRLLINWDDYFNITNNAFAEFRYDRNAIKVPTKMYYRFDRNFCNNTRYASFDVEKIFGARHLSFQTISDLSCLVLPNPTYRAVLKNLGFVVDRGDELIRGQIARILLTPNAELTYFIRKNLQAFDTEHVIGIQVRTGGWLASTFENGSFLRRTAVSKIGEIVLAEMERRQWNQTNCKVFLTSDSNIAVRIITGSLKDRATVIVPSGYKPGHSSAYLDGRNHYTHLYRAIMDLVLLSQTTPVLWTHGSSYGLLSARLSLNKSVSLHNSSVC